MSVISISMDYGYWVRSAAGLLFLESCIHGIVPKPEKKFDILIIKTT